jgi:hypothetical protein
MLCINSTRACIPESNSAKKPDNPVRFVVQFRNYSYLRAYSRDQEVSTIRELSEAKLFHRRESAEEVANLFNALSQRVILMSDGSIKLAVYEPTPFPMFDYHSESASARVLSGYRGSR